MINGFSRVLLSLLAVTTLIGCASWEGKVGTYTYDQAVREFGPPTRSQTMVNGDEVVEWEDKRVNGITGEAEADDACSVVLTFGPDGVLKEGRSLR